jgi:hypothetical protein
MAPDACSRGSHTCFPTFLLHAALPLCMLQCGIRPCLRSGHTPDVANHTQHPVLPLVLLSPDLRRLVGTFPNKPPLACAEEVLEPPDFVSPALLRPLPSGLGTAWHLGDRALLLPDGSPPYPQLAAAWPNVSGGSWRSRVTGAVLRTLEQLMPSGAMSATSLA